MTLAVLCPGQGGQHAGMFDLVAREDGAPALIAEAGASARFDVVAASVGPERFDNAIAQPLICAWQGIVWTMLAARLADRGVDASYTAGYSVGELAGHACAGRLSWEDCVGLACERAAAMTAAGGRGDGLAAVRGLTRGAVDALLTGLRAFVAIVNGDDHFIVGGTGAALDALAPLAVQRGATVQRLPVGVAAHTMLLDGAVAIFRRSLQDRTWNTSTVPTLAGIDGSPVRDATTAIDRLSRQVAETIHWSACMDMLVERGVTVCLELGPGNALARMMRERHRDIAVRSVEDFRSVDGIVDWVVRAAR